MKNLLFLIIIVQWIPAETLRAGAPDQHTPLPIPQISRVEAKPLKLLFSDKTDIADAWGALQFGVTPVRHLHACKHPGFTFVGGFPRPDGTWEVFGQEMTELNRSGDEPYQQSRVFRLLHATTCDGEHFTDLEAVMTSKAAAWSGHVAMAYNRAAQEYLLLKLKIDSSGFAYTAFFSPDGKQWREYSDNPLFYDGDAMSLFWSPVLHRFVCINKSLQPFHKHIQDHGGTTPALADESLRDRRVLMLRTSADGRHWEPSVSMSDVWNRHGRKGAIPAEFFIMPDANDPPDLEFYSGNAFWYFDRAYMMVLNYAASPLARHAHGPHLDNEWWTSRDGVSWQRPARRVNALEVFPAVPRLETHPMIINSQIIFPHGQSLLGLPEDRISFVSARANGEFSTLPFLMPDADLVLNAAIPAPERPFAKKQAYVMVAVLDKKGTVIPGYEAEDCLIRDTDRSAIGLQWGTASARELRGQTIRLRFFLRSANIYAVTTREAP